MPEYKKVAVTSVVSLWDRPGKSGRILLGRSEARQAWTLPGGKAEPGETCWDACLREIREESGLALMELDPARYALELPRGGDARAPTGERHPLVIETENPDWCCLVYAIVIRRRGLAPVGETPLSRPPEAQYPAEPGFSRWEWWPFDDVLAFRRDEIWDRSLCAIDQLLGSWAQHEVH